MRERACSLVCNVGLVSGMYGMDGVVDAGDVWDLVSWIWVA